MRMCRCQVVSCVIMFVLLIALPAFSQDTADVSKPAQGTGALAEPDTASQDREIAIYGEVQTADTALSSISVQYYDYDSDSEKIADIAIDAQTKLENVANLGEVKKGDWVDVTYVVKGAKNEAKIVTVEKEEVPMPDEETE